MPLRQLLISIAVLSAAAGVATWGIRTWQAPMHEATVIMSGRWNHDQEISPRNNRNRQVTIINDRDVSDFESTSQFQISDISATHPLGGTLMSVTVTAPSSTQAVAGANAFANEILTHPLGTNGDPQPLDLVTPAVRSVPTSEPIREAAAAAVAVGVFGLATVVATRVQDT